MEAPNLCGLFYESSVRERMEMSACHHGCRGFHAAGLVQSIAGPRERGGPGLCSLSRATTWVGGGDVCPSRADSAVEFARSLAEFALRSGGIVRDQGQSCCPLSSSRRRFLVRLTQVSTVKVGMPRQQCEIYRSVRVREWDHR